MVTIINSTAGSFNPSWNSLHKWWDPHLISLSEDMVRGRLIHLKEALVEDWTTDPFDDRQQCYHYTITHLYWCSCYCQIYQKIILWKWIKCHLICFTFNPFHTESKNNWSLATFELPLMKYFLIFPIFMKIFSKSSDSIPYDIG